MVEKAKAFPGFEGLYYLVDRSTGKAISVTLWETEAAMLSSHHHPGSDDDRSSHHDRSSELSLFVSRLLYPAPATRPQLS